MTTGNEKARVRAQGNGQDTYPYQVIEVWPACVVCARPIRGAAVGRRGARVCGCEGVVWRLRLGNIATPDRWVKEETHGE